MTAGREVDMATVQQLVDRAIRAAVPPDGMVQRRSRPESEYSWADPSPRAGFDAAQLVIGLAEKLRAKYVIGMRGEGTSWAEIADLLGIEWSSEYRRVERAFELVAGPALDRFDGPRVYWRCAGPLGCGEYITDRGPYESWPVDNERGHAEGCRRLATETTAREREMAERERRDAIREKAYAKVTDSFGQETVQRAWQVQSQGGRYGPWSHSETLAVALILHDDEQLAAAGYSGRESALRRVLSGMSFAPDDPAEWLATLRAAATGLED